MTARFHPAAWFKSPRLKSALRTLSRMLTAPGAADVASDTVLLAARLPSSCYDSWTHQGGHGQHGA